MADSKNLVTELEKLIKFVDAFEPVANASASSSSSVPQKSNDAAFEPNVPIGHTPFSWRGDKRISPKSRSKPKPQAQMQKKKQKKASTKPAEAGKQKKPAAKSKKAAAKSSPKGAKAVIFFFHIVGGQ